MGTGLKHVIKKYRKKAGRPRKFGPSVPVTVRLPDEDYAALAAEIDAGKGSEDAKITVSDLVREAVHEHIKKEES